MDNFSTMPAFGFPGWAMFLWVLVFTAPVTLASKRRIMRSPTNHGHMSTGVVMRMLMRMPAPRMGMNCVDGRWDMEHGVEKVPVPLDHSLLTLDNFTVTCSCDRIFQFEVCFQLQLFQQVSVQQSNNYIGNPWSFSCQMLCTCSVLQVNEVPLGMNQQFLTTAGLLIEAWTLIYWIMLLNEVLRKTASLLSAIQRWRNFLNFLSHSVNQSVDMQRAISIEQAWSNTIPLKPFNPLKPGICVSEGKFSGGRRGTRLAILIPPCCHHVALL